MTTSFHCQSPRVDEEAAFLDLSLPSVAVDDFSFMTPQLDTYPGDNCDSIDFSKLDIPLDNSLWDNFNPDLFASAEPSFHQPPAASNDFWFTDINSLPDPSSICFDTPQIGHVSPSLLSPDTTFAETALPSPDSDDSNLRLNWVRSTLKDLALARAAKDTRPVSQKTKQMDASIELYLQLQNDLGSGFQEECDSAAQTMVWQHSSTSTSGSSFDNNSFSVTGSPGSSTGTVPELSPTSSSRAGSASVGTSTAAQPSATGGVQMILDMNLNETTSLPRKHRPKTQEERQRYIAVRRQGACEWHRKQRKRCTCVDKTESAITTLKRKKLMKHVQNTSPHSSGAVQPVSTGDRWRRAKVRPSDGPLESWLTQDECLVPHITLQCCSGQPCNDPQCPECCCGSDEPITQRLQAMIHANDARQRHKPHIDRRALVERQPWVEPFGYDEDPGYALQSSLPDMLETRPENPRPISPHSQNTAILPASSRSIQDPEIQIFGNAGRSSLFLNPQLSVGDTGELPTCQPSDTIVNSTPTRRRVDAVVLGPKGLEDTLPSLRLMVRRVDNVNLATQDVDAKGVSRRAQNRARSQHDQTDSHTLGSMSAAVDSFVRQLSRTISSLASSSWKRCLSFGTWETPCAIRNKTTSRHGWREPSTNFEVAIPWVLLIWGCFFVSPILAIIAFSARRSILLSYHSIMSELTRAMAVFRMPSNIWKCGSMSCDAAVTSPSISFCPKSGNANLSRRRADQCARYRSPQTIPDCNNTQQFGPRRVG